MVEKYTPDRGDIVWFSFSPQQGREQKGRRPGLVLSSYKYNKHGLALICPVTSKIKGYPYEVRIQGDTIDGVVIADHIKSQDWKTRKISFIEKASKNTIDEVLILIEALLMN